MNEKLLNSMNFTFLFSTAVGIGSLFFALKRMEGEEDEIAEQYFYKHCEKISYSEDEALSMTDRVDPTLVGGAKLEGLMAVKSRFITEAVTYLRNPPANLEEETVKVTKTSGVRYRGVVKLMKEWGMVREVSRVKENVGLFLVPKKDGSLRIIIDARRTNARLRHFGLLKLFSLQELIEAWKDFEDVWVLDIRHFFWQIPIAEGLQVYFGILGCVLTVAAMGWHSAPYLAESLAWGIVLFKEEGEPSLGIRELPHSMPSRVQLYREGEKGTKHVGTIMVMIDGSMC